jgi:phage terminase small subunit
MARERGRRPTVPLTPAHQRLVDAYLVAPNAVQAYRAAYPGTAYRSAATRSGQLLKRVDVRAEIATARRAQQRRTRVAVDEVLVYSSEMDRTGPVYHVIGRAPLTGKPA